MTQWIRFERGGETQFGTLEGETITVHEGDMFNQPKATAESAGLGTGRWPSAVQVAAIVILHLAVVYLVWTGLRGRREVVSSTRRSASRVAATASRRSVREDPRSHLR